MSVLDTALAYLRRGWAVIPIRTCEWDPEEPDEPNKAPYVKIKEFQKRLPTPAEVRSWYERWPDAGVGIVTGRISHLVVVDFDGPEAMAVFSEWPETYEVKTARGAHKYYLLGPDDQVSNSVKSLGPGIDVRGEGGYVIAPPTVRIDGKEYSTLNDLEPLWRPGKLVQAKSPAAVGGSVFDRVMVPGEDQAASKSVDLDEVNELWVARTLVGGAPKGARNDTLARLTGYFAGKDLDQDITMVQMLQWGSRCVPPLDPDEVAHTVESVYRTAERRTKERAPVPRDQAPDVRPMDETEPPVRFLTLANFVAKYGGHEVEWLIEEWVPAGSILFAVSPPECFKSWLVGEFSVAVVTGTPIFGDPRFATTRRGPVLYMQQEDHHGQTAGRLGLQMDSRPVTKAHHHQLPNIWPDGTDDLHVQVDRDFHFENKQAVARLELAIETIRPSLVVLDPLYSMVSTDDFMVKAARQMRVLKLWRDRYGCTFVLVHHAGKGNGLTFDRERAWGSQFLNAFVEGGFQIGKINDRSVGVKRHYKMCQAGGLQKITWVIDTRVDPPVYAPILSDLSHDEVAEAQAEQWAAKTGSRGKKDEPMDDQVEGELPTIRRRKKAKSE